MGIHYRHVPKLSHTPSFYQAFTHSLFLYRILSNILSPLFFFSLCVHACMYIHLYVCVRVHTCVYTSVCVSGANRTLCACACIDVLLAYKSIFLSLYMCVCVCVHTYMCVWKWSCVSKAKEGYACLAWTNIISKSNVVLKITFKKCPCGYFAWGLVINLTSVHGVILDCFSFHNCVCNLLSH